MRSHLRRVGLSGTLLFLCTASALFAQPRADAPLKAPSSVDSITVPFALDQGRIVIDLDILLPNAPSEQKTERVRAWVDNGEPDLKMTRRIAALMNLNVHCADQACSAALPPDLNLAFAIRGMKIPLTGPNNAKTTSATIPPGSALAPGMSAEVNLPSTILRNYDVLVNFPDHELTIAAPGRVKFNGVKNKMQLTADGLATVPGKIGTAIETKSDKRKIENKNYDIALDLGSTVNYLSDSLFAGIAAAHTDWPQVTGAIGPFNAGDSNDEPNWKLMRIDRVQFGPLFLTNVAVANFAKTGQDRKSLASDAVLSSQALNNYRIGLDYAHATAYFDIGRTVELPDFDVVGLILRPVGDTGFAIAGIANFEGNPSVDGVQSGDQLIAVNGTPVAPLTLGEVWSLLEGAPGKERKLTIARAGKQFDVIAKTRHFLGEVPAPERR